MLYASKLLSSLMGVCVFIYLFIDLFIVYLLVGDKVVESVLFVIARKS